MANLMIKRRISAALAALSGAAVVSGAAYVLWLPDVRPLRTKNPAVTSFMLIKEQRAAARGKKLGRNLIWSGLDGISENLKHAVLIAEDDNFYRHHGVDWTGTWLALKADLKTGRLARGGSTITQQLARNLYLSPSKNPLRKIKEILIARRLEKDLGKRRILELYLNIAEWGKGLYGAQAASMAYFGKSAAELTPEEAAALAAILPSPRRYSPTQGTRFMEKRKSQIIARMRASGYLPEEAEGEDLDGSLDAIQTSTTVYLPGEAEAGDVSPGEIGTGAVDVSTSAVLESAPQAL